MTNHTSDTVTMDASICPRCGKVRIFQKQWKEKLERGSTITHTQMVCPDSDCQKEIEDHFAAIRAKKQELLDKKLAQKTATA